MPARACLLALLATSCHEPPMPTDPALFRLDPPGAPTSAIVRLDAPAPPIPVTGAPRQLRWDADAFYVIAGGQVRRIPRAHPEHTDVLATAPMLGELALAGATLLWTEPSARNLDGGGRVGHAGRVMRWSSGRVQVLVDACEPRSLATAGREVYFSNGDAIERIGIDGSGRTRFVDSTGTTPMLVADAGWLYFTRHGGVARVDAAGHVESLATDIAIPLALAVHRGEVLVLANAVISRPRPEFARPAQLLGIRPGQPPRVRWSADDTLVADLEVHDGRARFSVRRPDLTPLAPVDLPLD